MFGPPLQKFRFYNYSILNTSDFWYIRNNTEIIVKASILTVVSLISIVANSVILLLIIRNKTLHNNMYTFIANVCIADLLMSLYCPWTFVIKDVHKFFILGDLICHFDEFFTVTCLLVSNSSLVFVSFQRMISILYPFSKSILNVKRTILLSSFIWLASLAISGPIFYWTIYSVDSYKDTEHPLPGCIVASEMQNNYYKVYVITIMVFLPFVITCIAFIAIINKIVDLDRRLMHKVHQMQLKYRNRVIRMFFIIVVIDFICWFPMEFKMIYEASTNYTPFYSAGKWYPHILPYSAGVFMFLRCAINPFIYGIANENIRKVLFKTFPWLKRKHKVVPTIKVNAESEIAGMRKRSETVVPEIEEYHSRARIPVNIIHS